MQQFRTAPLSDGILHAIVLSLLLVKYGGYVLGMSIDIALHYVLIDDIMKHGILRVPAPNVDFMATYPPLAHWLAAIAGAVSGSGLVGLCVVSIVSVYVAYYFVSRIVMRDIPVWFVLLFALVFALLSFTHSQIGWEIVGNGFYPQIVGFAAYFYCLYWLSLTASPWKSAAFMLFAAVVVCFAQPLATVHLLAAVVLVLAVSGLRRWLVERTLLISAIVCAVAVVIGALLIARIHPSFVAMRLLAGNNGVLDFWYSEHVLPIVVAISFALGCFGAWRFLTGRGSRVDAVLGCAAVASSAIVLLQYLALTVFHEGSPYAVKKHMFVVVTLAAINAVRASSIVLPLPPVAGDRLGRRMAIGVAAFCTAFIFRTPGIPTRPIVEALRYADHAAGFAFPDFEPGNTVSVISTFRVVNFMISIAPFRQPMQQALRWFVGTSEPTDNTMFVMVDRPSSKEPCGDRIAESSRYAIVASKCLRAVSLGQVVSFASADGGARYLKAGWELAEPWGTWISGSQGDLILTPPNGSTGPYELRVDGLAFIAPRHPEQLVKVIVNKKEVATWRYDKADPAGVRVARIPGQVAGSGDLAITLRPVDPVSPHAIGVSGDRRVLGLGVKTLQLSKAGTPH